MKRFIPVAIVAVVVIAVAYFSMDHVRWGTVQSSTLNLSFEYPVHSSYSDPLKGTMQTTILYDHPPANPTDWTITTAIKNKIIATMSCAPLKETGAYLPLDRDMPMQCGVVKSPSGLVSVYAVGVGRPNGGTSYPESMVLTLEDAHAAMLTKVVPFTETQKEANEQVKAFTKAYPNAVIWPPDDNAQKLYDAVDQIVIKAISQPYDEVTAGIDTLRKIAVSEKAM
ncbi:MAG TPA: hypothetical protein VHA78_04205 [Candidatus Peribacteraceae bacterium]|nr:hypothetical protein [Candidatus Peribacteraceae bacterium]